MESVHYNGERVPLFYEIVAGKVNFTVTTKSWLSLSLSLNRFPFLGGKKGARMMNFSLQGRGSFSFSIGEKPRAKPATKAIHSIPAFSLVIFFAAAVVWMTKWKNNLFPHQHTHIDS